ncbi:MAG: TraR/DksA C4-type zinc finger protein [Verrucomicrobiota bacterium]|nr:TraR/DksA C4-type zinc finger protein [Verrucomicrobiota bacterium]
MAASSKKKTAKKAAKKKAAPKAKAAPAKPKAASKKVAKKKKKAGKVKGATAAAILGFAPKKSKKAHSSEVWNSRGVRIKADWKKYYQQLLDLRQRLLEQMGDLAKESAEEMSNYSLHMADSGTDNFDRDFALSLLSSDQDAVYEIEEALRRIEKDTFGTCELTGKTIPKTRLNTIPWTRFTVDAQAKLERDGALRHRKLGSLGTIDSAGSLTGGLVETDDKPAKSTKSKN